MFGVGLQQPNGSVYEGLGPWSGSSSGYWKYGSDVVAPQYAQQMTSSAQQPGILGPSLIYIPTHEALPNAYSIVSMLVQLMVKVSLIF